MKLHRPGPDTLRLVAIAASGVLSAVLIAADVLSRIHRPRAI